jgi:hypothetical protein
MFVIFNSPSYNWIPVEFRFYLLITVLKTAKLQIINTYQHKLTKVN